MIGKNLKYHRLRNNLTKKALAEKVGVSAMAITYYENDQRNPDMEILKKMADALHIRITDLLVNNRSQLQFCHGRFRKGTRLSEKEQSLIRESVEEYFGRFFQIVNILGGIQILEPFPVMHSIPWEGNAEEAAVLLRQYLGVSESGPVGSLVNMLENSGILVFFLRSDLSCFSGINGTVNGIPYVAIHAGMSPARIRSTIIHEISHFAFDWPEEMGEKEEEAAATAVSGAFLFPKKDAYRELGYRRKKASKDMTLICKEYGISMYLLIKRAGICTIMSESAEKAFYVKASQMGWRKNEPDWGIVENEPQLFRQLVYRAVAEEEISVQKGAELLKTDYDTVFEDCFI